MLKRAFSILLIPFLVLSVLLIDARPNAAASGGRMGGGSFNTPSLPSSGSYSGGRYSNYGGYRGGGIGFPFLLPIFGFGGGGVLGFLILLAITGTIVNAIKSNVSPSLSTSEKTLNRTPKNVQLIQIQLGLLASAKELKEDLRKLANTADTSKSKGLQSLLQETSLALLRSPEFWVYANTETGIVPLRSAESTFNKLSITERSKFNAEITTNVSGERKATQADEESPSEDNSANGLIVVTLIIATYSLAKINNIITSENIKENLKVAGAISSEELIALEILWQPEKEGEALNSLDALTTYPNLKYL